jgi:uncharacterized circularly permuted ATP-grasp superfamily protein
MDDLTRRVADEYDRLLNDGSVDFSVLKERFSERMRATKLTFGGRLLCPFLRPNFVSKDVYEQIRGVCRGIFAAIEKVEARLGEDLWSRVDLLPRERELMAIDPGYRRSSPTSRLDSFTSRSSYQFVELNAESPAGIAYNEVLTDLFLELPAMKALDSRYTLDRFRARERLLATLLSCYREGGGRKEHPTIAIVDYDEVPTRAEHFLFEEYFASESYPAFVCDPRQLEYRGSVLSHEGRPIDIVYKRLLTNEFLDKVSELGALLQAAKDRAVTLVNPFRCKPIHKKAIFAVLTDDSLQDLFSAGEREAIRAHVPWTRRVQEAQATKDGVSIDLPSFILKNRESLVMKPNDEYGGKGVFIGWETGEAEWARALGEALASSYVVQEKVQVERQPFPVLDATFRLKDCIVDLDPFVFNGEVEGFLTRLSESSLANVTSGGGQIPAFLVSPRS